MSDLLYKIKLKQSPPKSGNISPTSSISKAINLLSIIQKNLASSIYFSLENKLLFEVKKAFQEQSIKKRFSEDLSTQRLMMEIDQLLSEISIQIKERGGMSKCILKEGELVGLKEEWIRAVLKGEIQGSHIYIDSTPSLNAEI